MDSNNAESSASSSPTSDQSPNSHVWKKRKAGRKKFRETRHPIYRGVRERKNGRWVCDVREPNKKSRIWLGTFPTPEMAARAYDVAALALKLGSSTALNFPDSASVLPQPKSTSPGDIQSAALEAAEAFRPPSTFRLPNVENQETHSVESSVRLLEDSPMFLDEEALFNMPGLLSNMAEGMLITLPALKKGFNWNDDDCNMEFSLWSDE
ncbi:hypothetical protein IFM89_015934 [Coptis chinensis]|uniref:AP2/ERF domain-containing protein n=1 Tax=Coptis chinensis TaxID=261450 RepID=A0A835HDI2_9MAGN|nr:hypothetical protein IFM89_015934 [Coptis chinensis]